MAAKPTAKQQHFVDEYFVDYNATQAAIRAGYSAKTAGVQGAKLLKNPRVLAAVTARRAALSEKLEITQERVLQELAAVAFADAADFVNVTTVNRPDVGIHPLTGEAIGVPRDQRCVKFTDTATLPKEKRAALAAVKQSANGNLEIRLHDKVRALELLSKHLGLLDSGKHSADVEDLAPLGELLRNAKD